MTKIYFDIDRDTVVTRERDYADDWSGEDTDTSWSFNGAYLQKPRYFGESFDTNFDVKAGDMVYVVFAVWSDGDSFSRREGDNSEIFGVFDNPETAYRYKNELENATHDGTYGQRGKYLPWFGYFEHLDYVEVYERVVNDHAD